MTSSADLNDPVDPRQRRHARMLGVLVTAGFLALVVVCFIMFSINGLPKDAKEWKRMQERRAAAEAEKAEQSAVPASTTVPPIEQQTEPKTEKDSTR